MALVHTVFAFVFLAFIVVDRVFIRRSHAKELIYKRALFPLIAISFVIVISGVLLYQNQPIKAILGLATITLFFACPLVARRLSSKNRSIYRAVVLALALLTTATGLAMQLA